MREPGEDCPECGSMIRAGKCKTCGWKAEAPAVKKPVSVVNLCMRCEAESKSVSQFMSDDPEAHPGDRGLRLCPSCWIPALKRRAAGQGPDTKGPDGRTVTELIAEMRRIGPRLAARTRVIKTFVEDRELPDYDRLKAERLERFRKHLEGL